MMDMIVRKFTFAAAHRLTNHTGRCKFLHGHNWVVEVGVTGNCEAVLNGPGDSGMICDFGQLKERVGGWLNKYFDHTLLLNRLDEEQYHLAVSELCRKDAFLFEGDPTVENIGAYLRGKIPELLGGVDVKLCFLKIYETENSYYEWRI